MSTKRLSRDDELATAAEQALQNVMLRRNPLPGVTDAGDGQPVEVNVVETYAEAMLLTRDKGLVVYLSDGRELHLTITAYAPSSR